MFVRYTIILLMAAAAAVHLSVAANPPSSDETLLSGSRGLNAYVSKKGAKIRVYRNVSTGHGFGDSGTFEVFLDTIEELDANLDKLKGNHKTSSFSNVDFTVTQPPMSVYHWQSHRQSMLTVSTLLLHLLKLEKALRYR
jgi:hypothetical protein